MIDNYIIASDSQKRHNYSLQGIGWIWNNHAVIAVPSNLVSVPIYCNSHKILSTSP